MSVRNHTLHAHKYMSQFHGGGPDFSDPAASAAAGGSADRIHAAETSQSIAEDFPGMESDDPKITRLVGVQWRALSGEDKKGDENRAAAEKDSVAAGGGLGGQAVSIGSSPLSPKGELLEVSSPGGFGSSPPPYPQDIRPTRRTMYNMMSGRVVKIGKNDRKDKLAGARKGGVRDDASKCVEIISTCTSVQVLVCVGGRS